MKHKKRNYEEEDRKRQSIQITFSTTSYNWNIIKKNNSRSDYINKCIDYYESKHKTPQDKIKELKEERKQFGQKINRIDEKIENIKFKLEEKELKKKELKKK